MVVSLIESQPHTAPLWLRTTTTPEHFQTSQSRQQEAFEVHIISDRLEKKKKKAESNHFIKLKGS